MKANKAMKILGIIALVLVGLIIAYYLITWIISLISGLVALVVSGFQWFIGIVVFLFLLKVFSGGSGDSNSASSRRKPFFMPDARDGMSDAGKQVHNARDDIPDARDYDGHIFKNERDRRRW